MPLQERELIRRIQRQARATHSKSVLAGIGDDAAVLRLRPGHDALITTDLSIEGTHFRREWHPADSIGHRCLARGLSDIAAMGGEPVAAFLSLALSSATEQKWADEFITGLLRLAKRFKVELAGGDIAEAPLIAADIVVLGQAPAGESLRRFGAKPGDLIYVTGELGRSASVLRALREGQEKVSPKSADTRPHFFPEPRIEVGAYLRERGLVNAAIDVSDGLSTDLSHICEESGVGALVLETSIPRSVWPANFAHHSSALHIALHGGEDYELLFTAPAKAKIPLRIGKVPIRRIGEIINDKQHRIFLVDSHGQRKPLTPGGWQHFS